VTVTYRKDFRTRPFRGWYREARIVLVDLSLEEMSPTPDDARAGVAERGKGAEGVGNRRGDIQYPMGKSLENKRLAANEAGATPSLQKRASGWSGCLELSGKWCHPLLLSMSILSMVCSLAGCGEEQPTTKPATSAETTPAKPAVPEDIQGAAEALLGTETQVIVFGDLAKTGKQQFVAANVVPKTPKNNLPGTIVARAIIAENQDGKWQELLRCDEYLKNSKGYLGLTPMKPVSGWRLQYEQDPVKGLQLYFTPVNTTGAEHALPIGVQWNPAVKRYQSLDRSYEHFVSEATSLENARSMLR
jgi:hypothetical protein